MKMKIWIEEAMKEMVEEVEKMNRCQNIGNAVCCCSACGRKLINESEVTDYENYIVEWKDL